MTFRTEPSSYLFSKLIRTADERRPDRVPRSGVPKGVGLPKAPKVTRLTLALLGIF